MSKLNGLKVKKFLDQEFLKTLEAIRKSNIYNPSEIEIASAETRVVNNIRTALFSGYFDEEDPAKEAE